MFYKNGDCDHVTECCGGALTEVFPPRAPGSDWFPQLYGDTAGWWHLPGNTGCTRALCSELYGVYCNVHCTVYSVHCTAHCKLYCTLHCPALHCRHPTALIRVAGWVCSGRGGCTVTLYTVQCELANYTLYSVTIQSHCTLCSVNYHTNH